VFTDAYAYTYPSEDPGQAPWVDGLVGIEGCLQQGCAPEIRMEFPVEVTSLSLTFGARIGLPSEAVILEAFDANGNGTGTADASVPEEEVTAYQPIAVKATGAPIASARLLVKGVSLAGLVFDDFVFEQVSRPAPSLAIGGVDKVVGDEAVTFTVTVVNGGDAPSNSTSVRVRAVGNPAWDRQTVALDAVPAHGQQTVTVVVPIPAGVEPGTSQRFVVVADPRGIAGDPDTANNSLPVTVEFPAVSTSPLPSESEAGSPSPSVAPTPSEVPTASPGPEIEPASGTGDSGIPFLGGLLIGAVGAGGAAVLRYTRRIAGLNVELKGTLEQLANLRFELRASDADPPESCDRTGSLYCKRDVTFDPRRRTIASVGIGGVRGDLRISLPCPAATGGRLLEAARRGGGSPEAEAAIDALAKDLASSFADAIAGPLDDLVVTVRVTGSSAMGSFTPYVCTVEAGRGRYRRIRTWTKTIADEFDRTIASLPRFDASDQAREDLEAALRIGIRALATEV
jgi:hypothetical protein